ncbi:MAG: NADH-quinone oxidoreductase subunit C [Desulfobulbaceae bacterium]|jgi:NADH-quinone oxidoreductase subunit C|nr:NADH-quinone oxidoreductase subunit C [Desulfobulbaceae bacterium]
MNKATITTQLRALAATGMVDEPETAPAPVVEEVEEGAKKKAAPPAPRKNGLLEVDPARKGVHLDVQLNGDQVVAAAQALDAEGMQLEAITGVDWINDNELELVYDYSYTGGEFFRVVVRARIPRDEPNISTLCDVFPSANWHERETYDFFGINFEGHPQLENLLLPEDSDFHPLLKDFKGC